MGSGLVVEVEAEITGNRFITLMGWGAAWRGHEGASDPADEARQPRAEVVGCQAAPRA